MVCLDTDTIINFLRNKRETVDLLHSYISEGKSLATTTINLFELWKGIYRFPDSKREISLQNFLSSITILQLTVDGSKKAAQIFEKLTSEGTMVDILDVFIAAIALTYNEPLLTYNKRHFERINGLTLL